MIDVQIHTLPEGRKNQLKRMISREIRRQMTSQDYEQRKAEFLANKNSGEGAKEA